VTGAREDGASDGPVSQRTARRANGLSRPAISPLLWVAVSAWAGSLLGGELSLAAWMRSDPRIVAAGAAVALLGVLFAVATRRARAALLVGVVGVAAAVALLHGAWLADSAARLDARGVADWTATVAGDPIAGPFGVSVRVRLDAAPWGMTALVNWPKAEHPPAYGERVVVSGRMRATPRMAASATAFRRGELVRISPWRVRTVGWAAAPLGPIASWRASSLARLDGVGLPGAQTLKAMLFAVAPTGEGATTLENAKTAGVAWAVTASGLHLGALVILLERIAALLGCGRRGRAAVTLGGVVAMLVATGLRLSFARAAFAAAAGAMGRAAGRRRDGTAALGAVVTVLILIDPSAAYDVGLLLGSVAVLSIAVLGPLAAKWLMPVAGRSLSRVAGPSVAAQVAVAPLAASLFGGVALLGPLVLLGSAPLVSGAVLAGFAGCVLGAVLPCAGGALLTAGSVLSEGAGRLWAAAAGLTPAFVVTPSVPWWIVPVWVGTAVALWARWPSPRRAGRVRAVAVLAALAFCATLLHAPGFSAGIDVLDVGQGDAILVRDGAHTLLVDAGPDPVVLRRALARAGVRSLDGVVITHAHADHDGGLPGLAGIARPAWIGVPDVADRSVDDLARACASRADAVVRLRRDMVWKVGETTVRVLWPRGGERGLSANDTSVVLLLERSGRWALLLGDAEEQAQRGVQEVWSRPVEFLKVAHHGSPNGNVPQALAVWRPRLAFISVGKGNTFGHPSAKALDSLAEVGAVVRRTDQEGDLIWDPAAPDTSASRPDAARMWRPGLRLLCDNRCPEQPFGGSADPDRWTDLWHPATWPISSPCISSMGPRSCCSSVPRSGCATVSPLWLTSTSTSRRSMATRPPPRTSSTLPTPCRS
jgi:competence protein ComEC